MIVLGLDQIFPL